MRKVIGVLLCIAIQAVAACGSDSPTAPPVDDHTPAHIRILSGDAQTAKVSTSILIAVIVTDRSNRPVAGIPVTFTVIAGEGSVGANNIGTDANGRAATDWKLGRIAGFQSVRATVPNLQDNVAFGATATP